MNELFLYQSYYIVLYHIPILFLLGFINTLIYLKAKKSAFVTNFLLLQSILALWMISKLLKTFAPDVTLKFFFVICYYAGVSFLGPLFIRFAYIFTKGNPPSIKIMAPLYICSFFMFLAVATNPLHYLFYSHFDFSGDSFGPFFYAYQAVVLLMLLTGVFLCLKAYFSFSGQKRIHAIFFSASILIPISANILYIFRLFKPVFGFSPPFDITPVSAAISLVLLAFATFRLELFDSLNVALEKALSNVPQGILLIGNGKVAYKNRTFQNMIQNGSLRNANGVSLIEFSSGLDKPQNLVAQNIRVISQPIANGTFISCMNITEIQTIIEQLKLKNKELDSFYEKISQQAQMQKRLVAAKIRNAMAAEAHDVLGHSLILALSLLEIAHAADDSKLNANLRKAAVFLKDSLPKLMESSLENRKRGKDILLRLKELAGELSDVSVGIEVSASGVIRISSESADVIYKICRESITNALRHSGCSKIDVILKGGNNETKLFVIDDGRGCKNIKKGMGMEGMEQRARLLGGSLYCRTLGENSFCVEATLPAII